MDYSFIDEIPQTLFTNIQEVGSGAFSDIFSAIHIPTNTKVALKVSLKCRNEKELKLFKQEIAINRSLHHPFICKYFTDIETEHLKIIVMELIEGVSLLNYVNKMHGLPLQESLNLFTELVIALEYLHNEVRVSHRDLKFENIMIDKYNHIRLIDFGFSSDNSIMSTCCGSIPYCAPEILMGQKYTKASDIWSLGIILYALIDGNLPFYHPHIGTLAAIICENEVEFTANFHNSQVQDLILKMLKKDPEQRITIDEIKKHPSLSQQKLLQINYKQLFQPYTENSSSQKFDNNENVLSKSSICIQFGTGQQKYPLLKEISSSNAAKIAQSNIKENNLKESTNDVDELIKKRKDFSMNLHKLIETALSNTSTQKCIILRSALSNNFGSHLGCRRINCKRNNPYRMKKSPVLQPNVNNNQKLLLEKNVF